MKIAMEEIYWRRAFIENKNWIRRIASVRRKIRIIVKRCVREAKWVFFEEPQLYQIIEPDLKIEVTRLREIKEHESLCERRIC